MTGVLVTGQMAAAFAGVMLTGEMLIEKPFRFRLKTDLSYSYRTQSINL